MGGTDIHDGGSVFSVKDWYFILLGYRKTDFMLLGYTETLLDINFVINRVLYIIAIYQYTNCYQLYH